MDNVKFHIKLIKMEKYHKDNLFIFIHLNKSNILEVVPESQRHYSYPREHGDLTVKH